MTNKSALLLTTTMLLFAPSCVMRGPVPDHAPLTDTASYLSWLEEGMTREKVLLQLGTPWCSFENGRILCYLLDEEEGQLQGVETPSLVSAPRRSGFLPSLGTWDYVKFDLVLVFDLSGRLVRHQLFGTKAK